MKRTLRYSLAAAAVLMAGQAAAQITFYAREGFRGEAVSSTAPVRNMERLDFDDRASSVYVERGRWEVCDAPRFEGRCAILRRGGYESLRDMGLHNAISSARPVERQGRYRGEEIEPVASADYEFRRRANERVQEVPVTSVRAVVGPPNQRCWIERQQVPASVQSEPNVGGAIAGALIGGILGHQVGGGSGRDAATAAGVVGGAAIGANTGRAPGGTTYVDRDVQRCQTVSNTQPEYWDVTYNFRGMEHRVQMATPPGRTIIVNANTGEPRM